MKKTYTITIETKADGTMPDAMRIENAVFGCAKHCDDFVAVKVEDATKSTHQKGDSGIWDLRKLAIVDLGLSNLQIVQLNEYGEKISDGLATYQSVVGSLTNEEAAYLSAWLENEGIDVSKEG